jgi:glycosyltransferase involved in cell wall biosynthesis
VTEGLGSVQRTPGRRLGERGEGGADDLGGAALDRPAGMRIVLDVRPLQEPERSPTTAIYLSELLTAFAADPLAGESFALLLQAGLDDPTGGPEFAGLDVVGRRLLPPTRLLRSGALTIDPFLLRGASLGIAWRAERGGAGGAVYHTAIGAAPLASGLPVVVTILDLAPWELAGAYQATLTARFGHRLRARILRDARAVIVGTEGAGRSARRLLHVRRERIHVVPLAPRAAFERGASARSADEAARLGLPSRYLVYPGRYDARQDLGTLLRALAAIAAGPPPAVVAGAVLAGAAVSAAAGPPPAVVAAAVVSTATAPPPAVAAAALPTTAARSTRSARPSGAPDIPWPPRIVLVGASPDDRAALARAAAREGVGELISYTPALPPDRLAAVVAGARAVVLPVLSEAAGLAAIEAIACGTPVIASNVGVLPEIVGAGGILVEPRAVDRLAVALRTAWSDDAVHARLLAGTGARAGGRRRTWADVAADTRAVYAEVGTRSSSD